MGGKKKKKDPVEDLVPIYAEPPPPEEEQEKVEYTDTSYTSASWEDVPPLPIVEESKKKKKKKRADDEEEDAKKDDDDLHAWSEESFPEGAQVVEVEEDKPVPGAGTTTTEKTDKKKKKGKKDTDQEAIPDFEKPKNWAKMDGKQKEQWLKERIDQWRAEAEAEKQAKLAHAKEKRAQEAKDRAAQAASDNEAMEVRRDLLYKTCRLMARYEKRKRKYDNRKQQKAEWVQYLTCDGLPDPRVVTQMATYLHVWKNQEFYDDNELDKKCKEVLPMLEMLEEFVANARNYTVRQAYNYNEIRLQLREQLAVAIECASYGVIRNLEDKMKWHSIKLCTYERVFNGLKLNLWVAVKMPTQKPRPVSDWDIPAPVELEFPGIKVSVTLPTVVDAKCICVRASRSMIDFLSESSRTFSLKEELADRYMDFFTFNVKEHVEVCKKREEQEIYRKAFFKALRLRTKELENLIKSNVFAKLDKEKEELESLLIAEPPIPLPEPRSWVGEQNEKKFREFLKTNNLRTRSGEVNLRKYKICGGVLYLDLLITPPQAKRMVYGIHITTLELPKALKWVDYKVQYRAPPPPPDWVVRTPEVIEAEMIKIQHEYEKLALVFIELPSDVLWNEPPIVVQWQEQRKLWTSNYINEFKFNEEKLTVQFRTGVLWPIGIACLKYGNMPYQGWDIRPDTKGKGVTITVTGMSVTCTWNIVGNAVKLIFIANASTRAMKDHFHKRYSVKKMVQLMREAACDFFPDFDAHNQCTGTCPKEWAMERHLYHAMAFLCRAYNFQWSRWNAEQGFRRIVIQMREAVDPKRESNLALLLVTPQKSVVLSGVEHMTEWDETEMIGMKFYPDLFTMNLKDGYASLDARRTIYKMKFELVETVFNFLQELKLCSFS